MYKKRHRVFKYCLVGGSKKAVIIDETKPVETISDAIGQQIGLKKFDEFGLRLVGRKRK
jgi:hypothetical protein